MVKLRFRQLHLDFHTSADCPCRSLPSAPFAANRPHVDQSWLTSGLSIKVLRQNGSPGRIYLAPDKQPLPFTQDGDYLQIDLPPVGAHTVVVVE